MGIIYSALSERDGENAGDANQHDLRDKLEAKAADRYAPQAGGGGNGDGDASSADAPTADALQGEAERLKRFADIFSRAAEQAYGAGDRKSGDEYRQRAIENASAASVYAASAFRARTSGKPEAAGGPFTEFAPGWNTGDQAAGLPEPGNARPDYVTAGGQVLSGSGGVAMNVRDGTAYRFGGVVQNDPRAVAWQPGFSATAGWILGAHNADDVNDFLNGNGNQFYVSIPTPLRANVVGAVTHAYGGRYALELGLATPGKLAAGVVPMSHAAPIHKSGK